MSRYTNQQHVELYARDEHGQRIWATIMTVSRDSDSATVQSIYTVIYGHNGLMRPNVSDMNIIRVLPEGSERINPARLAVIERIANTPPVSIPQPRRRGRTDDLIGLYQTVMNNARTIAGETAGVPIPAQEVEEQEIIVVPSGIESTNQFWQSMVEQGREILEPPTGNQVRTFHYTPQIREGGMRDLRSFAIRLPDMDNDTIVAPSLIMFQGEWRYQFRSNNGTRYINQYQDGRVRSYANRIIDSNGVCWAIAEVFESELGSGFVGRYGATIKKSKKKLFRKKGKVPEIKEEEYYAGNDFIA